MILQLRFIIYKYSERREKSISSLLEYALPSRILYYINIVKGENKAEINSKIVFKAMPES